jgi:hypothetical protein
MNVEEFLCQGSTKPISKRSCSICSDGKIVTDSKNCTNYTSNIVDPWWICADNIQSREVQCIDNATWLTTSNVNACPGRITTKSCGELNCQKEIDGVIFRIEPCSINTTMTFGENKSFKITLIPDKIDYSYGINLMSAIWLPSDGVGWLWWWWAKGIRESNLYFDKSLPRWFYSWHIPIWINPINASNTYGERKTLHFAFQLEVK